MFGVDDLEAARDDLHAALPPGWVAGRPFYRDDLRTLEQYAYDPRESRRGLGHRTREWTAVGEIETDCVRELARCLWEFARVAGQPDEKGL